MGNVTSMVNKDENYSKFNQEQDNEPNYKPRADAASS